MAELARGGYVDPNRCPVFLRKGDCIMPTHLVERYKDMLDKINEGLDSPDEDGVE